MPVIPLISTKRTLMTTLRVEKRRAVEMGEGIFNYELRIIK
jgi:hypothetical protein